MVGRPRTRARRASKSIHASPKFALIPSGMTDYVASRHTPSLDSVRKLLRSKGVPARDIARHERNIRQHDNDRTVTEYDLGGPEIFTIVTDRFDGHFVTDVHRWSPFPSKGKRLTTRKRKGR